MKRVRHRLYQRFDYHYPGPIHHLRHRLMVVPASRYFDQQLCQHQLQVVPEVGEITQSTDVFGNHVLALEAAVVEKELRFEVSTTVERRLESSAPRLVAKEAAPFARATPLTAADARIADTAASLAADATSPEELAALISDYVYDSMRYGFGATGVETTAAQALDVGKGLCQDYAHIMLALCRELGLAARYVSGHMLGEGGSHAWAEVLFPQGEQCQGQCQGQCEVVAFDPTNRRRPNLSYITVAIGRDYRDVAPTSGSFTAPYSGTFLATKQAGLTLVEYEGGRLETQDSHP